MNDEPLMVVVVETVVFLELSDESIVDEDAAVAMLESISATLQQLDGSERDRFRQYLRTRAALSNDDEERQVIEAMADSLSE